METETVTTEHALAILVLMVRIVLVQFAHATVQTMVFVSTELAGVSLVLVAANALQEHAPTIAELTDGAVMEPVFATPNILARRVKHTKTISTSLLIAL